MEPDENGNINCIDCIDCTNCTNCDSCTGCTNCTDCINCDSCTGCTNCFECTNCTDCTDYCENCAYCISCRYCRYHGYGYYSKGMYGGEYSDHCYYIEDDYYGIKDCYNVISIKNLSSVGASIVYGNNMIGFTYIDTVDYEGGDIDLSELSGYCSSDIYSITEVIYNDSINLKPSIEFTSYSISMFSATLPQGLTINKTTGVISGTYNLSESYSTNVTIQTTSEFGGRTYTTPLTFIYNENRNINCINCIGCSNCVDCIDCTNCNNCYNCSNCSDCSYFDTCENCRGGGNLQ